ncbi:hypothetical protein [Paenibacillus sp. GP183]|uniref:hypothetical protein n=1 Tax=Paenibacillus sp. GP183 TaxID=1882751 RepID=UPI00089C4612|nr:hypothetical protein [Paenibacillus sp. GP183]SED09211.1 hypothetical protein SAMN05443246_5672 [Paenibacillus sp. GP183]
MLRIIFSLIVILILISGCKSTDHFQPQDLDKIKIVLVDKSEQPSGTAYTFKLSNKSNYVIVENELYLSYPITSNNGLQRQGNKLKVEATGNKLNISPGNELMLNFFVPKEDYQGNQNLDPNHPDLEFKGYLGTLTDSNHFYKSGGLDYFSKTL